MFLAGIQRLKPSGKRSSAVGGYVVVVLASGVL